MVTKGANEVTLFAAQQSELIGRVKFDADTVSLTDLWKEAGSPNGKNPNDWTRQDSTQQLIETVALMLNTVSDRIIKTKKGKGGGTYAHKNIALSYAKYLDPRLHVLVNELFFQRVEEEKNPDLLIDRYQKAYQKRGKSDAWIGQRAKSRITRNEFTHCLAAHGVEREGFRNCTNATYAPLFGGSSNVVREKLGIDAKENPRDHMSEIHLTAISLAEQLAQQKIEGEDLRGNAKCELACRFSAQNVARAITQNTQLMR